MTQTPSPSLRLVLQNWARIFCSTSRTLFTLCLSYPSPTGSLPYCLHFFSPSLPLSFPLGPAAKFERGLLKAEAANTSSQKAAGVSRLAGRLTTRPAEPRAKHDVMVVAATGSSLAQSVTVA